MMNINKNKQKYCGNKIPKKIWAYWEGDIPDIVKLCWENWKKYAPDYKITILNNKTAWKYINKPKNFDLLPIYRKSDIIRLLLVEKYGGVYMDSSIILTTKLDNIVRSNMTLFLIPGNNKKYNIIENWFIAAKPNNPFIKAWCREVKKAILNEDQYLTGIPEYQKNKVDGYHYLICHLIALNLIDNNNDYLNNTMIYESSKTAFKVLMDCNGNAEQYINGITSKESPLLIKIRGIDRKYIKEHHLKKLREKYLNNDLSK